MAEEPDETEETEAEDTMDAVRQLAERSAQFLPEGERAAFVARYVADVQGMYDSMDGRLAALWDDLVPLTYGLIPADTPGCTVLRHEVVQNQVQLARKIGETCLGELGILDYPAVRVEVLRTVRGLLEDIERTLLARDVVRETAVGAKPS